MIFGVWSKESPLAFRLIEEKKLQKNGLKKGTGQNFAFYYLPETVQTSLKRYSGVFEDRQAGRTLLIQGDIFGTEGWPFVQAAGKHSAAREHFWQNPDNVLRNLNGHFAGAIYDGKNHKLTLFRDHFGVEPLYYYQDSVGDVYFGSNPLFLLKIGFFPREINFKGLHTYLLFNYIPLEDTIVAGVKKVKPGHLVEFEGDHAGSRRYWYLSFEWNETRTEEETAAELVDLLKDAVRIRIENGKIKPGAFLSGGMDSSSVVGLSSQFLSQQLHTFSFRCKGESYDESHYAQFMSDAYKTKHHLVEFPPEESLSIRELVDLMPEPFSDIGIEVASFILARYAQDLVDFILSGDGGDELFAGHPVYIADRMAQWFDKVPSILQKPVIGIFQLFPDSDKKKSFTVKAKRFAYSFNFPAKLYSNRWRIYYTSRELEQALVPDAWEVLRRYDPLEDIAAIYKEADGPDFLSKTLYGDYATVVNFYLMRMYILRHFGIEARFPMFDYRLVEFAATIPSHLKIPNNEDTKYILKKAMEGILPDEIVHRKDKLGHSVPMKNWMRDAEVVKSFLRETLSEENVKRRGLFKPEFVNRLFEEHQSRKFNHSHRLWAMAVLELWMQKHFDLN